MAVKQLRLCRLADQDLDIRYPGDAIGRTRNTRDRRWEQCARATLVTPIFSVHKELRKWQIVT
jgi:hypothetical protein